MKLEYKLQYCSIMFSVCPEETNFSPLKLLVIYSYHLQEQMVKKTV